MPALGRFRVPVFTLILAVTLAASLATLSRIERARARDFVRKREIPALGQAIVARLSLAVAEYRRAGEAMLDDGIVRDWILSGERDPFALISFMSAKRADFGRDLLDMSIVSDASETFYSSDGRILALSPEMKERDGWYYAYRDSVPSGNVDSWYNDETGVIEMYVNVPILGDDGAFLGVAGGSINSDQFMETVRAFEREHSARVYLFRGDGEIVYATNRSLVRDRVLSADSAWNEPVLPSLMRTQESPFGVVLEPNGPGGPVLWGGRIPDWDTFVIVERGPEEIRSLASEGFVRSFALEGVLFAVMIAAFIVSWTYLARRSLAEERIRLAADARSRAIVEGHSRLGALAEGWLSGLGEALLAKNAADLGGKDAIANARFLSDSRVALKALSARESSVPAASPFPMSETVSAVRASYAGELARRGISLVVTEIDRGLVAHSNEALVRLAVGELIGAVASRVDRPAEFFLSLSGTRDRPCLDLAVPAAEPAVREGESSLPGMILESIGAAFRYLEVNESVGVYHAEFAGSDEYL